MREEWTGFKGSKWTDDINVRQFIQDNYTPYDGDESFLGSGESSRSFRRRNAKEAASLSARRRLSQV